MMTRARAWIRVAMIDLRGGMQRFVLLMACMALGVSAVGTVGTLRVSVESAIAADARDILGGDLEILSRGTDIPPPVRDELGALGRISRIVELNTQARVANRVAFLALRAVDHNFPLVGSVQLEGGSTESLSEVLAERGGVFGLLLDRRAALQLGVAPGATVRIGLIDTQLRGILASLPDEAALGFQLGAPALISDQALASAGLRQDGVLNQFRYKVGLADKDFSEARDLLDVRFHDHSWRIRSPREATAGLSRVIGTFSDFMLLVGLISLVVGGLGVTNSVSSYLAARRDVVATMRALGASSRRVVAHFLTQVVAFALLGVLAGLQVTIALAAVAAPFVDALTSIDLPMVLDPGILASAASLALATAVTFAWLPLWRAQRVRPARLFRAAATGEFDPGTPRELFHLGVGLPIAAGLLAIATLTLALVDDLRLVAVYYAGVLTALALLRFASAAVTRLLKRLPVPNNRVVRLALSAATRPGAPTTTIVVSFGLGLALLLMIAITQLNIEAQLAGQLGGEVPDFVLLDMPRTELTAVSQFTSATPEVVGFATVPMLRGVITSLKDAPPPSSEDVDRNVADMFRGDTALTWAAEPPTSAVIDEGQWWPPDYSGPPLTSLSTEMRDALGLAIGDTLEVTIAGRPLTMTIASFRRVEWRSPAFNFRIVASPGAIQGAPQSYFATLRVAPGTDRQVQARLLAAFPALAFVPVRDAIERVEVVLGRIASALSLVGATALVAGLLVLASALGVGRRQREADAVVMKVLGARRRTVILAFLLEYAVIGTITAIIASAIAVAGAWAVSTWLLDVAYVVRLDLLVALVLAVVAVTTSTGAATTWSGLSRTPARFLREADQG